MRDYECTSNYCMFATVEGRNNYVVGVQEYWNGAILECRNIGMWEYVGILEYIAVQ